MFDTDKLWDEAMQKKFCQHIQESAEPEACGNWGSFRDGKTTAAHDTIGVVALRKRREGLPSDVADLVSRRHQARLNGDKPFSEESFLQGLGGAEEARVREICDRVSTHLFTSNSGVRTCLQSNFYSGREEAHLQVVLCIL